LRRSLPVLLLVPAITGLGLGCYEDSLLFPDFAQGTTRVFLTDAPFPYGSVGTVEVYVVEISASTEAGAKVEESTWTNLATPRQRFDLLQMQQGNLTLVNELQLPTDIYHAVRVTIDCDSSKVTFIDGTEARVLWPQAGQLTVLADVPVPIAVPDSGASVVLDFDVGQSFAFGLGGPLHDLSFVPKIRAVNGAATGSISGTILADMDGDGTGEPVQNAMVTVLRGELAANPDIWQRVSTGHSNADGYYRVGFLLPDAYIIRIETPELESFGTLYAHDVEVIAGENFVFSVTLPSRTVATAQ